MAEGFLNGFALKILAVIAMILDHIGAVWKTELPWETYLWLRTIGRLAFPIYAFLITEGMFHTRNVKKYALRLGALALLSEIPFDLAFSQRLFAAGHQNIFFTLVLGLALLIFISREAWPVLRAAYMIGACLLAELFRVDYGAMGIIMILCFYLCHEKKAYQAAAVVAVQGLLTAGIQRMAVFSGIPILFYNGKRGPKIKYFFYLIYPVHLLALYWLHLY